MDLKRITSNFSWKLTGALVGGVVNFIYSVLLMRALGPSLFGQLSFALSWASFFVIFIDFGFNPILTRDLSVQPQLGRNYFNTTIKLKIILLVVSLSSMLLVSSFLPKTKSILLLLVASYFFLAAVSFTDFAQAITYAYEKFKMGALFFISHKLLGAVLGISAIGWGMSLVGIVSMASLGGWLGAGAAVFYFGRFLLTQEPKEAKAAPKNTYFFQEAYPILITMFVTVLYFRVDTIFLIYMTSDEVTGVYNSAYRFFEVTNILPAALVASIQSRLARHAQTDSIYNKFWKSLLGMLALAAFVFTCLVLVSYSLPTVLSDPKYESSGPLLRILSWALIPLFMNYLLISILTFQKKQKKLIFIAVAGLIFNVGANFYAIPRWQAHGAAVTTCLSELLMTILYFKTFFTRQRVK